MGLAAATPGVTRGRSGLPQGRDPQGRVLRRTGSFPRHIQGERAAQGREGRRHDRAQAQVAGLRGCGPVLSAERVGRHRQGGRRDARRNRRRDLRRSRSPRSTGRRGIPRSRSRVRAHGRRADDRTTSQLNWRIAEGYYLYKQRIKLEPANAAQPVGALVLPKGEAHSDEYFGEQEVYRAEPRRLVLGAAVGCEDRRREGDLPGLRGRGPVLSADHQDAVDLARRRARGAADRGGAGEPAATSPSRTASPRRSRTATCRWCSPSFFGGGLLLAFTPCVLPMVPILSGIIAGGGENMSTRRAFLLSLSYVLGMAFTYAAVGVAVGADRPAASTCRPSSTSRGSSCCSRCCSWCWRASMFGAVHHRDAELHPDAAERARATSSRRARTSASASWARCRRSSSRPASRRALIARADLHQPDRRRGARRRRAVRHRARHGHAAAAGRRVGGRAAAARRRVDGHDQESVRRDVPRAWPRGCCRASCRAGASMLLWAVPGVRRWPGCCGVRAPKTAPARNVCRARSASSSRRLWRGC